MKCVNRVLYFLDFWMILFIGQQHLFLEKQIKKYKSKKFKSNKKKTLAKKYRISHGTLWCLARQFSSDTISRIITKEESGGQTPAPIFFFSIVSLICHFKANIDFSAINGYENRNIVKNFKVSEKHQKIADQTLLEHFLQLIMV